MSKSYLVLSIAIPIMALIVGLLCPPYVLALVMVVIEVLFSVCLYYECKPSERRPKSHLPILAITLMAMSASSCVSDWYGKLFIHREPVTFRVYSGDGMPLGNAEVKSEELDAFDNDLIIDGTHYTLTDEYGKATVEAVFYNGPDVSLAGRTTRFTFTAAGYAPFDTIFHYWEGPVDITLNPD